MTIKNLKWNQKLLKKHPMWLIWKAENHTTGVPAVKVRTNHFVMVLIKERNLCHVFLLQKSQEHSICADARTPKTRHFVMEHTGTCRIPGFLTNHWILKLNTCNFSCRCFFLRIGPVFVSTIKIWSCFCTTKSKCLNL